MTNQTTKPIPPRVPGNPILGNLIQFMRSRTAVIRQGYALHGPIFSLRLGPQNVAVVAGEEAQRTFFTQTDHELRMDKAYGSLRAIFGDIAFTASPETYNEQRHILHAPFKGSKMPGYVRVMQHEIQAWLDSLGEEGEIDLAPALVPLVQNVAAHAIMGREFRDRMGHEFWDLYADLSRAIDFLFPPHWPLPKFIRRDRATAKMDAILKPILAERREHADRYDDMLQDFVNARYLDGRPVEDEIIIGLIKALMFAGHETTVGQAAWTIVELLRHPEYQSLVQEEIDAALPYGKPVDLGTLASLNHIEWAVRETTRTHPSADMILRYAEEPIDMGEYHIPQGWLVLLSSTIAQNLPETFREPERFDPLRFAPGREEDAQHRFAITGFGGGVHKCTGMNFANNEMAVITALLFQQFDLELLNPNPATSYTVGAGRPDRAIVRYRRKPDLGSIPDEVLDAAVAAGCPHITALQPSTRAE